MQMLRDADADMATAERTLIERSTHRAKARRN
jgi:hypothetical protein